MPKAKKPVPATKADLIERFKDYPGIQAFERALESPDGPGSLPILLKGDPDDPCMSSGHQDKSRGEQYCRFCAKEGVRKPNRFWYVRHVNTKQKGRVAKVKAKAMIPVELKELKHPDEIADLVNDSADGLVHTGTNGALMLYKIPLELRNIRIAKERATLNKRLSNPKTVREDLANDAAARKGFGAEAADTIYGMEFSERSVKTSFGEEIGATSED